MVIRQLEPHEYSRLDNHEGLGGVPAPRTADYIIAEDDEGTICAFWCIIPVAHVEPVWIAPEYRNTTISGRLWRGIRTYLDKVRLSKVYCFAATPPVASYLSRLGFVLQPFLTYQYTCPLPSPLPESPLEEVS